MENNSGATYLVQVNINGLGSKKNEIQRKIDERAGHDTILLLNDTRLKNDTEFNIPGYYMYRKNHPSATRVAGGVAIMLPESIRSTEILGFENLKETLCVEFKTREEKTIRVMTTYLHPGETIKKEHFMNLVKTTRHCDLIVAAGDFNAKVGVLDGEGINKQGEEIIKLAEKYELSLINKKVPTYYSFSNSSAACLDLMWIKNNKREIIEWNVTSSMGSDHLPTELEIQQKQPEKKSVIKWAKLREEMGKIVYEKPTELSELEIEKQ